MQNVDIQMVFIVNIMRKSKILIHN
jgi:hypothetical protein